MTNTLWRWLSVGDMHLSLDLAGLVLLADVSAVARRTVLTGTASFLDAFVLCPGLHKQQDAATLSGGEYPACAAMTSGYVFRVENEATVSYLQKIGRPGQLTTLSVSGAKSSFTGGSLFSDGAYIAAVALTMAVFGAMYAAQDRCALSVMGMLVLIRLINVVVIRRRAAIGWKGEPEPGVQGDLLILLSQDRWVRMRGAVDDLKAVTSGQWLREATFLESSLTVAANMLLYVVIALVANAQHESQILLLILFCASAALVVFANEKTTHLKMYGRSIESSEPRKKYARRLDLAKQLIEETKRHDWAMRMGMINDPAGHVNFDPNVKDWGGPMGPLKM